MEDEKVKAVISIIKAMDLKNELRLGVCMTSSAYTNISLHSVTLLYIFP